MKILRIILSIIVVALSSYGLLTGTSGVIMPYALLLLGIMLLIIGITEFQEKRKATAITLFFVTGFSLFVSIYTLLI
ncbi:DUF3953 domain-containing protein [Virgibacillus ndiopensis]|uniref:DUF3953 domain-containing protein n=1 Tax=Virgibacillus ndiopensis TaxID=2004408 RepID=UPI000C07D74A|nr:DUF3953 domain-containing protein [Virgibacillus ndiopensis]